MERGEKGGGVGVGGGGGRNSRTVSEYFQWMSVCGRVCVCVCYMCACVRACVAHARVCICAFVCSTVLPVMAVQG